VSDQIVNLMHEKMRFSSGVSDDDNDHNNVDFISTTPSKRAHSQGNVLLLKASKFIYNKGAPAGFNMATVGFNYGQDEVSSSVIPA
jgi:hypothetical protein